MTRAVIFDFDFTLVDSSKGFLACHSHVQQALGLPMTDPSRALATIGMSLAEAFRYLYGPDYPNLVAEYVEAWQRRADDVMTDLTFLIHGAPETVRHLHEQGYRLAIVSQKLRYRIEEVLAREGLLDCFAAIIGGADMPRFKPEPDGLELAIRRSASTTANALYVGDTVIDAETATRAGVPFVAVLTGVTPAEAFIPHAPAGVLPSVVELAEFLQRNGG